MISTIKLRRNRQSLLARFMNKEMGFGFSDDPYIQYHLYSGNAADMTERLDKGLLQKQVEKSAGGIALFLYKEK